MALKDKFPPAGSEYVGGQSDGWEYKTTFSGSNLKHSYEMVKAFLKEEGYEHLPLPQTATALALFRLKTRNKQILLFEDNGYVHFPIKILFPTDGRQKRTLILCIYNEKAKNALLKFHRKGEYEFPVR